jgi:hypothetical protein
MHTIVFLEKRQYFRRNGQKSQKNMILTSTPGLDQFGAGLWSVLQRAAKNGQHVNAEAVSSFLVDRLAAFDSAHVDGVLSSVVMEQIAGGESWREKRAAKVSRKSA